MRRPCATLALLLVFAAAASAAPREWSPRLLTTPEAWHAANEGKLSVTDGGLTIEVAHDWAGATLDELVLPPDTGKVRLDVRLGEGARFTLKFEGDLHGDGKQRFFSPAWGVDMQGPYERPLDPRAINPAARRPLRVMLVVEGKPGARGTISALDFLPVKWPSSPQIPGQKSIRGVDLMPNLPQPYVMLDWKQVCRDFDHLTFDTKATGEYLPLCVISPTPDAQGRPFFSQTTYLGDTRAKDGAGESINSLWAMVSASVSGIDKRHEGGADWVSMADAWFCTNKGLNLLTDYRSDPTPLNYWYDLQPTTAYAMLMDLYPGRASADRIFRASIDTLARVHDSLKGPDGIPNYDFSGYEYDKAAPATTGSKEPDNAGNAAWLFYLAYKRYGDPRYLARAQECLRFWDRFGPVPIVETGLPLGALAAARMNAELGLKLPADRYIQRCFEFSHERGDHTVVGADRWGETDVSGMWEDPANKAYYYESCSWSMVFNVARYDPSYARAMGKWMLNLANSLRLFFPGQLPPENQSNWAVKSDPAHCIPYERLNWGRHGKWLWGGSDAPDYGWKVLDLSLYSGAMTGFIGGRVAKTDVSGILQLDLLAFDTFHDRAYPTYLYYNPFPQARSVTLDVGNKPFDLYDTVSKRFLARRATGNAKITIPADRAVITVIAPAGGKLTRDGRKLLIDGVVVDYAAGQ